MTSSTDANSSYIADEKYVEEFVWFRVRKSDGRWFFCTRVQQLYVKFIDTGFYMGHDSPWVKIKKMFYTKEELTLGTLKGDKLYFLK